MAIVSSLSIITLNVNGLNSQIKRYKVTEWIFFKTQLNAVYKRLTLDLKTHIDRK